MRLSLRNVALPLADFALEINLEIQGRVTVIFGPSGSGKTSLLDVVAGLRRAASGFIEFGDQVLADSSRGLHVPAHRRRIGYLPQDLALFPHLSVRRNLMYGRRSPGSGENRFEYNQIVELLEIGPLVERGIAGLSGGEKQRVALARALLASPRLLLLDEPLASLDLALKRKILPYLGRIRSELGIPMLYVTHDRFETLSLADELVVLSRGKVLQRGPCHEVFNRPANLSVAGILTMETILPGRVLQVANGLAKVSVGSAELSALVADLEPDTAAVHVCLRGEDVMLSKRPDAPSSARNHLPSVVTGMSREGALMRVELEGGFPFAALLTRPACEELDLQVGDRVIALVKAPNVHLIPRSE